MNLRELLRGRAKSHLIDWIRYQVILRLDEALTEDETRRVVGYGVSAFRQLCEILWQAVEDEDVDAFGEIATSWARTLWDAERHGRAETHLETLAAEHDRFVFSLAMWIVFRADHARDARQTDALGAMFQVSAGHLAQPQRVAAAHALTSEHHEPWSTWYMRDRADSQVHSVPSREYLTRTALVLSMYMDADGAPFSDKALLYNAGSVEEAWAWVRQRADVLAHLVGSVEAGSAIADHDGGVEAPAHGQVGPRREQEFAQRIERLKSRLALATDEAERKRQLIIVESEPVPAKLESFQAALIDEQKRGRLFRELLAAHGAVNEVPPPSDDAVWRGLNQWLPKEWFIEDSGYVVVDHIARDLGRVGQRDEAKQIVEGLVDAPLGATEGNVREHALRVLADMRDRGCTPSLVLVPLNWRLSSTLTDARLADPHPGVPAGYEQHFEGAFAGSVPILDQPQVPDDRFFIIDLRRAYRFEEWDSDDNSGVHCSLTAYDENAAIGLLEREPIVGGSKPREQALEDIRKGVLLELQLRWRIVRTQDHSAVAAIAIPEDLRQRHG